MGRYCKQLVLTALLGLGVGLGLLYSHFTRAQFEATSRSDISPPALPRPPASVVSIAAPAPLAQAAAMPPVDPVSAWIEAAASENPVQRAVAIAALGRAPAARALPVLRQVMASGEVEDRPVALTALRELALADGDVAGSIREALRIEVYDGNDERFAQSTQAVLAELDERLIALR